MSTRTAIPVKIRREILIEAGHRCAIQTCRNTSNIDIHHIIPWEKSKNNNPDNLITLCPNCHRLVHEGKIDKLSLKKYKVICQKLIEPPMNIDEAIAYIKFNPNITVLIFDSKNIDALVDNGVLDFSFVFEQDFIDFNYIVNAIGDGVVDYKIIEKTKNTVRIIFNRPCPENVKLEFKY